MHDVRGSHVTQEMFAHEVPWALAGFVHQSGKRDAVFGGVLPVKVTVLNGCLSIEAGAIVASAAVPRTGTHANFMERVQLRFTYWLAQTYWHWSNASLARRNPGVDAFGVTVRVWARETEQRHRPMTIPVLGEPRFASPLQPLGLKLPRPKVSNAARVSV